MEPLWSLIGVVLGAGLAYFSSLAFFKEQRKETKRLRQLCQIEKANVILHKIDKHVCDVMFEVSVIISRHNRSSMAGDVSDCFIELEFLVSTYVPKGRLYLIEIRSLANKATEWYNAVNTLPFNLIDAKYELSSLKIIENNFRDSVDHLREEIVSTAKSIEQL